LKIQRIIQHQVHLWFLSHLQHSTYCSAPESIAKQYLSVVNWAVDVAVDNFFANPPDDDDIAAAHAASGGQASFDRGQTVGAL
jgi:hypothetical protein